MISPHKLTQKQRIGILQYERGVLALMNIVHYNEINNFATPDPDPLHTFISSAIGTNFTNFYHSDFAKMSFKLCKGFVPDTMVMLVYDYIKGQELIDINILNKVDKHLNEVYNDFLRVVMGKYGIEAKHYLPFIKNHNFIPNSLENYREIVNLALNKGSI